jgi:hypothetical protein
MKELLTTNKKAKYFGDSRYEKVWEQMKLLGIQDVSTTRQSKNGTIVWKLPIKMEWPRDKNDKGYKCIEVASFKTGYVRNQNSGYSNYQLNKRCESEPSYYPEYDCNGKKTDKYVQFTTRTCKLIPVEIDRLEYLISYCLKNYYIKHANFVADGEYVRKWRYDHISWRYDNLADAARLDYDCGHRDRINDLESEVRDLESKYQASQAELDKAEKNEFYPYSMEIRVNGQKYKVV